MRLLLIEDDTVIGSALRQGLSDAGFSADWVMDGHAAGRGSGGGMQGHGGSGGVATGSPARRKIVKLAALSLKSALRTLY